MSVAEGVLSGTQTKSCPLSPQLQNAKNSELNVTEFNT